MDFDKLPGGLMRTAIKITSYVLLSDQTYFEKIRLANSGKIDFSSKHLGTIFF